MLGAAGDMAIEGMTLVDALIISAGTLSAVGFGEVQPLNLAPHVTIGLIVVGVSSAGYLLATAVELEFRGQFERVFRESRNVSKSQFEGPPDRMRLGRLGPAVVHELMHNQVAIVVVESNPAQEAGLSATDVFYVIGSALHEYLDGTCRRAFCPRDSGRYRLGCRQRYVSLSGREKFPKALIHAFGESEEGLRRLRLVGKDQVLSAYRSCVV